MVSADKSVKCSSTVVIRSQPGLLLLVYGALLCDSKCQISDGQWQAAKGPRSQIKNIWTKYWAPKCASTTCTGAYSHHPVSKRVPPLLLLCPGRVRLLHTPARGLWPPWCPLSRQVCDQPASRPQESSPPLPFAFQHSICSFITAYIPPHTISIFPHCSRRLH